MYVRPQPQPLPAPVVSTMPTSKIGSPLSSAPELDAPIVSAMPEVLAVVSALVAVVPDDVAPSLVLLPLPPSLLYQTLAPSSPQPVSTSAKHHAVRCVVVVIVDHASR